MNSSPFLDLVKYGKLIRKKTWTPRDKDICIILHYIFICLMFARNSVFQQPEKPESVKFNSLMELTSFMGGQSSLGFRWPDWIFMKIWGARTPAFSFSKNWGKNLPWKTHRFGYVWDNYLFKTPRIWGFSSKSSQLWGRSSLFEPINPLLPLDFLVPKPLWDFLLFNSVITTRTCGWTTNQYTKKSWTFLHSW